MTLPADFCAACHQDVARERPSHAGFAFDGLRRARGATASTTTAGSTRASSPGTSTSPRCSPRRACPRARRRRPEGHVAAARRRTRRRPRAPRRARRGPRVGGQRARAGRRRCAACHDVPDGATGMGMERPARRRRLRRAATPHELARLRPRPARDARAPPGSRRSRPRWPRLPMRPEARDVPLGCESCHGAHAYDTRQAAVDACLGCHDDRHSRAYQATRHFHRSGSARSRARPRPGSGVSCATCHLPRRVDRQRGADVIRVDHDQNDNLQAPRQDAAPRLPRVPRPRLRHRRARRPGAGRAQLQRPPVRARGQPRHGGEARAREGGPPSSTEGDR